jgi:hypothetical protein
VFVKEYDRQTFQDGKRSSSDRRDAGSARKLNVKQQTISRITRDLSPALKTIARALKPYAASRGFPAGNDPFMIAHPGGMRPRSPQRLT